MPSTLEHIAELSGVSRSTVSRVVNNDPQVSPDTRARVLETIAIEGYRPNLPARGLASGKTNVIAAVIPGGVNSMLSDPYFPNLLQGVATAADARDYFVMLALVDPGFRHNIAEIARQGAVDGVIFSAGQIDDPLLERLAAEKIPVVSVGRPDDDRVSYVDVDNLGSARQATNHLLRLGNKRVATIAGPSFAPAAADRLTGFKEAIRSFGLRVDESLIYEGDFSEAGGRFGMRLLLEHRPDAVFAASDRMAAGALNEIGAAGLRVPDDIAVVGFDDIERAGQMEPPLTTVRQRPQKMGETALTLLMELIADPASPPQRIILPTELVVRASCGSLQDRTERQYTVNIRRFRVALLLVLAMSLIAAACSSDSDDSATTTAAAGGDETTTTAASSDDGGTATTAPASGEPVELRWFIGMGAGTDAPVIPLQQAVVDEFNAVRPLGENISLKMEVVDADNAATILQTQIAGGNPPDIVGPMGVRSAATFFGGWLDIAPYIEANNYDLSDFDPAFVEFWNIGGEQIGLPFGAFPSMLWYNSAMFDEAGLAYPPQEFDVPYVDADGNEMPWNADTLVELATVLSVDENGLTPADDGFNPDAQVQWGWCGTVQNEFRGLATLFGAGNFVADDKETFQFPEPWQDFAKWYHDAIYVHHITPTPDFLESELLANPSPLGSGNCAMMATHTWFQGWGTGELSHDEFDTASVPAGPSGAVTAKLHADTFAIPKSSSHPNEAFQVVGWMLGEEQAPVLASIYGALPARKSAQEAFVTDPANDAGFTWQVGLDSLAYPDIPSHEAWWPSYIESIDGLDSWWDPIVRNPDADVEAEIPKLEGILQPIFDRAEG